MGNEIRPNTLRAMGSVRQVRPNTLRSEGPPAETAAWFGPNSEAVLGLLRRLASVDTIESERLAEAWRSVPASARGRAHAAAQAAAEASGRRRAAREAQEEAMSWADAPFRSGGAVAQAGAADGPARDRAEVRREAMPAVLDAVAALVLSDLLRPADAEVLYGPWEQAIEPPSA